MTGCREMLKNAYYYFLSAGPKTSLSKHYNWTFQHIKPSLSKQKEFKFQQIKTS